MERINWEFVSSYWIFAARYFGILCAVLWLFSAGLELIKMSSQKKHDFYKGVFWMIYLVSALACGLFMNAIKVDTDKKATVLMVLFLINLVAANQLCQFFEITARKTVVVLQYFWVKIKKYRRF